MITTAFTRIDRRIFNDELDSALIWAQIEAKGLLMEITLKDNERWARLTKAIDKRYPMIGHDGCVFLAATAMLSAKIEG